MAKLLIVDDDARLRRLSGATITSATAAPWTPILNRSGTGSAHIGASSRPSGASALNLNIARTM